MDATKSLSVLSDFKRALSKAESLGEVADLRDKAEAVRHYCKAARMGTPAVNAAIECKLMAERKAGGMLATTERKSNRHSTCSTLEQLGIERKESHRWQRIASVPDDVFKSHIEAFKESNRELTTASVLKLAAQQPTNHRNGVKVKPIEGTTDDLSTLAGKKFGTIYADPPWSYGNQATRASTDNHYGTMSVEDIAAMPIADLAADDAHLHLWTTNGFLFEAKQVIEGWGFEYKSCYVWVKSQIGIGNYWRLSHEFLLLGIRGNPKIEPSKRMRSWDEYPRGKHSGKPEAIRLKIEKISPGPYLELFGRKPVAGWTVFGNQIEDRLFA